MLDQVLDQFLKATESTVQFQQELFRSFTQPFFGAGVTAAPPPTPSPPAAAAPAEDEPTDWVKAFEVFHKQWTRSMTELLERHHKTLDEQYGEGIKAIKESFRAGRAKDPVEFRRAVERVWARSFESLKGITEGQMKEFQAATEAWLDAATTRSSAVGR